MLKTHSKIVLIFLALLRCLSTCKITKFHSSRKLESCISFLRQCMLVKLGSYIISPILPVRTCKIPNSKIPHSSPTVLKCLSACQLRKTMKFELSGNFPLTWSLQFGWLFQVIRYFHIKYFVKPQDSIPSTLGQKKRIIWETYRICIECNGI